MPEIRVIEKPDTLSYELIRDVIHQAHKAHIEKGIIMKITTFSAEELEERIVRNNGKCFIATENERVVGTVSYIIKHLNHWYKSGDAAELTMIGILPNYQGKRIFSMLYKKLEEEIRKKGYTTICCDTPVNNIHAQQLYTKAGFTYVDYFASPSNHYSVEMLKWLNGCPFSKAYCVFRYNLKKLYSIIRFKPGRIKRFGI